MHDVVLVKPKAEETESASGIILPDKEPDRPDKGEVVAVGQGIRNRDGVLIPMSVKLGEIIMFKPYAVETFESKDETFLIVKDCDIIGVIEKE